MIVATPCPDRCGRCGSDEFNGAEAHFSSGVNGDCWWAICRRCPSQWHARRMTGRGERGWIVREVRPLPAMAAYERRTMALSWIAFPVALGAAALLYVDPVRDPPGSAMPLVPFLGAFAWSAYRELRVRCFWRCPQCSCRLGFLEVGPGPTCLYLCKRCDVLWNSEIAYEPYNPSDGS